MELGSEAREGPAISVVTACYNSLPFIDRLAASLRAQDFKKFEWVCVDDLSTDATVEHLRQMEPPGELGMQVYRLPQNGIASVAIAFGVQQARGDAIVIMDHDDEFMPHAFRAIADGWPRIADDPNLCGLAFQAAHPDGRMVGRRIPEGTRFTHNWMMNVYEDVHDATFAIKASDAKACHDPATLETICSWGVVMSELTRNKRFLAAPGSPIRYYHRDNPQSQMNDWKLSRKWVATCALALEQVDRHALRRPVKWFRNAVALTRFSKAVHGSYFQAVRMVKRPAIRALVLAGIGPAFLLDRLRPRTPTIIEAPIFPIEQLDSLQNLHA